MQNAFVYIFESDCILMTMPNYKQIIAQKDLRRIQVDSALVLIIDFSYILIIHWVFNVYEWGVFVKNNWVII